jgi:LemA protein
MVQQDGGRSKAWADVENAYQRRMDLIPNLVKTVQGAADYEKGTLTEVIEARAKATSVQVDPSNLTEESIAKFQAAQDQLSSALSRLMVVVERYPELKANQNFLQLQNELRTQEEHIANSRKYYNAVVREFNTKIEKMPGALFAGMFGFVKQPLYEISDTAQRENVSVQF